MPTRRAQWAADRVAALVRPEAAPGAALRRGVRRGARRPARRREALAALAADLQQPADRARHRAGLAARRRQRPACRAHQRHARCRCRGARRRRRQPRRRAGRAARVRAGPAAERPGARACASPRRAACRRCRRRRSTRRCAPAFDAALAEYIAAQNVSLDMPGARLNLAVVHQNTGRPDLAEAHYLAALKIDPDFTPARANLAQLYNADRPQRRRRARADRGPEAPARASASCSTRWACCWPKSSACPKPPRRWAGRRSCCPQRARVHYNLGLALQQLGRRQPAEQALLRAAAAGPRRTPPRSTRWRCSTHRAASARWRCNGPRSCRR